MKEYRIIKDGVYGSSGMIPIGQVIKLSEGDAALCGDKVEEVVRPVKPVKEFIPETDDLKDKKATT